MSYSYNRQDLIANLGNFDVAEAVSVVFEPGRPINVRKIVLVCVEAVNGNEIITVAVRNADGTSSVTSGNFTVPNGLTVNSVRYVQVVKPTTSGTVSTIDGSLVYDALPGNIQVNPGQELVLTSTGATATTGQVNAYIEYEELPNALPRFAGTELTFTRV